MTLSKLANRGFVAVDQAGESETIELSGGQFIMGGVFFTGTGTSGAKVQMRYGSDTWRDSSLGALSGDTNFSLYAPSAIRLIGTGTNRAQLDFVLN